MSVAPGPDCHETNPRKGQLIVIGGLIFLTSRKDNMKHLLIISAVILIAATPTNAGWFDHEERQRRIQTEHELQHQRQTTGAWQVVSGVLGTSCIALLV